MGRNTLSQAREHDLPKGLDNIIVRYHCRCSAEVPIAMLPLRVLHTAVDVRTAGGWGRGAGRKRDGHGGELATKVGRSGELR